MDRWKRASSFVDWAGAAAASPWFKRRPLPLPPITIHLNIHLYLLELVLISSSLLVSTSDHCNIQIPPAKQLTLSTTSNRPPSNFLLWPGRLVFLVFFSSLFLKYGYLVSKHLRPTFTREGQDSSVCQTCSSSLRSDS